MEIQVNSEKIELENDNKNSKCQNLSVTHPIVSNAIDNLMNLCFEHVKQKQILTFVPNLVQNDFMNIMNMYLYQSSPNYGTMKPSGLKQQDFTKLIKIQKDNLSPKQLPSQSPQKSHTIGQLPENLSSSIGSRRLNMTNRSFMKRKSQHISQLVTGATTQRTNLQKKISSINNDKQVSSVQKTSRSIASKKDPLRNFTSLVGQQSEDPQIIHLREKVLFNSKEKQRQQAQHNERLRHDQQKIESFNSQISSKGHFTFGFDGQPLVSQQQSDEKINYYAMKVGIKTFNRKFRSIYKHLEDGQYQPQSIIKNRTLRQRQNMHQTLNLQKSVTDIPIFVGQKQQKTFRQSVDPGKMRIQQYRRLYGRKFSRYDHNSLTIDVSKMMDKNSKNTLQDDLIMSSRRHLTDSISVNKSRSSSVNKQYLTKKLALPRLQGKYKVLDRYQDV